MVAEMVLAELAGRVTEVVQELGESGRPWPQVGRTAGQLRRDHTRAQRLHAGGGGVAPGGAPLLSAIGHEDRAFVCNPVNVWRFPAHHAPGITTPLHPASILAP